MKISVLKGDITTVKADAIVNAANTSLLGGGGVDGAIHRAGGPEILKACKKLGGCPTGEAVITTGGNLPARYVIHTPGPVWKGGEQGERTYLRNSYRNSLRLAEEYNLRSLAFPNISTGIYGFPRDEAARIAVDTVKSHPFKTLEEVIFVCFDEENYRIYQNLLDQSSPKP